jgi:hypothetical protein
MTDEENPMNKLTRRPKLSCLPRRFMIGGVAANPDVLEGAEKIGDLAVEPAMSWQREVWTNVLKAVPKAFISRCKHSRRPAETRRSLLLRKLRIDKPRLPNR